MSYKKYVTFSFDDGLEQDKRIVEILKQYGLKATFNLNSGLFGKRGRIGRIGDYGLFDLPERESIASRLLKSCPSNRIPADEIAQVYEGFEIAAHGYQHENLKKFMAQILMLPSARILLCCSNLLIRRLWDMLTPAEVTLKKQRNI